MVTFAGRALPLGPNDVLAAAGELGCKVEALRAVIATETSGRGFDAQGRPTMLREPHVFYRLLAAQRPALLALAVSAGLAYPNWGEKPYPADSYPGLISAMALDETTALQSCSWGLGQIMGGNYQAVGFASVQDMVAAAQDSELAQLLMMVRFIRNKSALVDALVREDWEQFAAGYNGPGHVPVYAARLRASYAAVAPAAGAPSVQQEAFATTDDLNAEELARVAQS